MRQTRSSSLPAAIVAALLPALFAVPALPAPLAAQSASLAPPPGTVVEGYVARAVLDPAVAGTRARVAGAGARLLLPLQALSDAAASSDLARRVAVGGFLTAVPEDESAVAARHYGVQADVRLTGGAVAGRLEPLASLGVGAFHGRRLADRGPGMTVMCLAPTDVAASATSASCLHAPPPRRETRGTYLAVSPALGVRVGVLPGLALRADARDVIVHRGGARHNLELGTGLSFVW